MGQGKSKASVGSALNGLSVLEKTKITKDIKNHTKEQNDNAENFFKTNIQKQKEIIGNYDKYVLLGKIQNKSDPWWKSHEDSYNSLKAQYDFFKKERKRLRK